MRIARIQKSESDEAVANWIESERPDKYKDEDYFENDMRFTSFPVKTNSGELSHGSSTLPHEVTTGPDGHFRFSGIGRNRLVILNALGPSIAKQNLSVVTREMTTVKAKLRTYLGTPDANHYGAKVNFVARPTQPIIGRVVDLACIFQGSSFVNPVLSMPSTMARIEVAVSS